MTAQTPPTGAAGDAGKATPLPSGRGVRTVIDPTPSVHVSACLAWVRDDRYLCHLPAGHNGSHLALPIPWPRQEITRDNPRWSATR